MATTAMFEKFNNWWIETMTRRLPIMSILTLFMVIGMTLLPTQVRADTPFIGEIRLFGGNFAPRGFLFCDGALLPIAQNTALFSILGTTYGGDGRTTFGLPDLRGRTPIGPGSGPGLTNRRLGEKLGQETVALTSISQLASHSHPMVATTDSSTSMMPGGNLASSPPGLLGTRIYADGPQNTTMNAAAVGSTGSSLAHNNMQPFLALNYIIAIQGVFPSRN